MKRWSRRDKRYARKQAGKGENAAEMTSVRDRKRWPKSKQGDLEEPAAEKLTAQGSPSEKTKRIADKRNSNIRRRDI